MSILDILAVMAFGAFVWEIMRRTIALAINEWRYQQMVRSIEWWRHRPFQARRVSAFEKAIIELSKAFGMMAQQFTDAFTKPTTEVDERKIRRSDKAW